MPGATAKTDRKGMATLGRSVKMDTEKGYSPAINLGPYAYTTSNMRK